jgi:hypothetical protein
MPPRAATCWSSAVCAAATSSPAKRTCANTPPSFKCGSSATSSSAGADARMSRSCVSSLSCRRRPMYWRRLSARMSEMECLRGRGSCTYSQAPRQMGNTDATNRCASCRCSAGVVGVSSAGSWVSSHTRAVNANDRRAPEPTPTKARRRRTSWAVRMASRRGRESRRQPFGRHRRGHGGPARTPGGLPHPLIYKFGLVTRPVRLSQNEDQG